jgi:hypothetical protein
MDKKWTESSKLRSTTETNWPKPKPGRSKRMASQDIFLNKFWKKPTLIFILNNCRKRLGFFNYISFDIATMRRTFCFQLIKGSENWIFFSFERGKCLIWREGGDVEIYIFFLFHQMSGTQKVEDVARLASMCTFHSALRSSTSVLVSKLPYQLFMFPHPLSHSSTSVLVFTLPYQLFTLPYPLCPQFHISSSLHTSIPALNIAISPLPTVPHQF